MQLQVTSHSYCYVLISTAKYSKNGLRDRNLSEIFEIVEVLESSIFLKMKFLMLSNSVGTIFLRL